MQLDGFLSPHMSILKLFCIACVALTRFSSGLRPPSILSPLCRLAESDTCMLGSWKCTLGGDVLTRRPIMRRMLLAVALRAEAGWRGKGTERCEVEGDGDGWTG